MLGNGRLRTGEARSTGAILLRRVRNAWPADQRFRILSLDGGGIRGVFPATILAELERRYIAGRSIADYFDLVAGTSTGGILSLGLGAGLTGRELQELYVECGREIFPPPPGGLRGRLKAIWRDGLHYLLHRYDRVALEELLASRLGAGKLLGSSKVRLIVPAFEGRHSEVFIFKTPHHPDYKTDRHVPMVTVGLATAAAPAFFRPLERGGYLLVDGGVWANNPVMLAVIEALSCFMVDPSQIDVLTIGCGDDPYIVSSRQIRMGGLFFWKDAIFAAMRLQSLAATNQARLLLGPSNVLRLDAPTNEKRIELDDWRRSVEELVPAAVRSVAAKGDMIAKQFLVMPAQPYTPCPEQAGSV